MREKCIKRVGEMKWILLLMVFLVAPAVLQVSSLPETQEQHRTQIDLYMPAYSERYCRIGPPVYVLSRISPFSVYQQSIHCWRVDYNAFGQKLFELHLYAVWRYDGYRIVEVLPPSCWTATYLGWYTSAGPYCGWSYVLTTSAKAYAQATFSHPLVPSQTRWVYAYVYGDGTGYCGG
jgi:hypothetical protein